VLPDHATDALKEIALTIIITLRHHRAVQRQDNGVDRHGSPKVGENLVAKSLVYGTDHDPAGLSEGAEALHDMPTQLFGFPPPNVELSRTVVLRLAGCIAVRDETILKGATARGQRRKSIRLRVKAGNENLRTATFVPSMQSEKSLP
jgi:hypothetical protein